MDYGNITFLSRGPPPPQLGYRLGSQTVYMELTKEVLVDTPTVMLHKVISEMV